MLHSKEHKKLKNSPSSDGNSTTKNIQHFRM